MLAQLRQRLGFQKGAITCSKAERIKATLASRVALRLRLPSSPIKASRRQWLRFSLIAA